VTKIDARAFKRKGMMSPARLIGLVLLIGSTAVAIARPVSVSFNVSKGSESLAFLLPELGRAVAVVLKDSDGEVPAGRIEELPANRIRLTLTGLGREIEEEGPLEELDQLANRLGERWMHAGAPVRVAIASPAKSSSQHTRGGKNVLPAPPPASDGATKTASLVTTTDVAKEDPPKPDPPKADPPKPDPPKADPPRVETPSSTGQSHDELREPYARRDEYVNRPAAPPRYVVRQVAETPTAWGAGYSATHALYNFLRTRFRMQLVPTGAGMVPGHIALDEVTRNNARGAVMARIVGLEPVGSALRCTIELVVIRPGRVPYRRVVSALPNEVAVASTQRRDPVYWAVLQALEQTHSEIAAILAEP
jgi:hypothetical protein